MLRRGHRAVVWGKQDGPRTGGALVNGKNVAFHVDDGSAGLRSDCRAFRAPEARYQEHAGCSAAQDE